MIPMVVQTGFLTALISGGGVTMLLAAVQVYRALKVGAATDEQDEFTRLEHAAAYESAKRSFVETERDYWHRRAAAAEFELTRLAGAEVVQKLLAAIGLPPVEPPLPEHPKRRRRRLSNLIFNHQQDFDEEDDDR